jgi:hypothetical protein
MSEEDRIDYEELWAWICGYAAKQAGISAERAEAILEDAGMTAYDHTGTFEAIEVVSFAVRSA